MTVAEAVALYGQMRTEPDDMRRLVLTDTLNRWLSLASVQDASKYYKGINSLRSED